MVQPIPTRGFLKSVGLDPPVLVEFQFNPAQITDRRVINYAALNAPGLLLPVHQYIHGGDRTISFTVRIDALFSEQSSGQSNGANQNGGQGNGTKQNTQVKRKISLDQTGSIVPELNKYRAFLYPRMAPKKDRWQEANSSFVPLYASIQQFASPPTCLFGFGEFNEGQVIRCIITEISITELLFNTQMLPLRAEVAVTLVELAPYEAQATPPPGGI